MKHWKIKNKIIPRIYQVNNIDTGVLRTNHEHVHCTYKINIYNLFICFKTRWKFKNPATT